MTLALYITPRAARELERINERWQANRPSAPDAVVDDLQRMLSLLRTRPDIGANVAMTKVAGVRRVQLDRVHYWLYYRVGNQRLEVLSVWHSRRGSGPSLR